MKKRIGIMCGRLSKPINNKIQAFPISTWRNEFAKAEDIGFELIEWVIDINLKNPILNDEGIKEIKLYSDKHHISINSVSADYFMSKLLFNVPKNDLEKNLDVLKKILKQCNKLNIEILEIPLVDSSSLHNTQEKNDFVQNLEPILDIAKDNNVKIALETDLPPESFKELLIQFNHPNIMINYDVGDSTSNGFNVKLELELLKPWIVNVHVKDRKKFGNTVPLGTGDTDFDSFFKNLQKIGYNGNLLIQGAREDLLDPSITPEYTCKRYLDFVRQHLLKYPLFQN